MNAYLFEVTFYRRPSAWVTFQAANRSDALLAAHRFLKASLDGTGFTYLGQKR